MLPVLRRTCLLLLIFTAGCASADPSLYPPRADQERADLIIMDNRWHTSVILRTADLPPDLRRDLALSEDDHYVVIGWGDQDFYRAEEVTTDLVPQAMFYSRGSVLSVIAFAGEPEDYFMDDIYRIPASRAGLARLIDHVDRTFAREEGRIISAGTGAYDSYFYKANGRYGWNHTCNHWTAAGLQAAGLPITPFYAGTAWNVAFQIRQLSGVQFNDEPITRRRVDLSHLPHHHRGRL